VGDVRNPAQAAVDLAHECGRIAAHAIADAIIRAETAEAALQRTQTERDCMSAALGQEIAGLTAEVARLREAQRADISGPAHRVAVQAAECDARSKALEEAVQDLRELADDYERRSKILAAREVGQVTTSEWIYEAARLEAMASHRRIVPETWAQRDEAFRAHMTRLDALEKLMTAGEACQCGDCESTNIRMCAYHDLLDSCTRQLLAVARAADNLPDWLPEDAHVGIQAVKDNAGEIWMEIMRLRTDLAPLLQEVPDAQA